MLMTRSLPAARDTHFCPLTGATIPKSKYSRHSMQLIPATKKAQVEQKIRKTE